MKDEYMAAHPESANNGIPMGKIPKGCSMDEEERNSAESRRSESPAYHTGSSEPPNDLISPPMGGSIDTIDRRLRRQIANCNERRRMQSINAGFQSLKLLLPRKDGEKLSKAAILQHTVELIQTLRAEKMKLIEEKEAVINTKKRKIQDDNVRERGLIDELTAALEHERRLRHLYERMFSLWTNSPVLSQFLSKPNPSMINPAVALQNVVPPALQTRGFTGLLPPALLIDSLLINARISNNGYGSGGTGGDDSANGGTGTSCMTNGQQQQTTNATTIDFGMFTGNLVAETAASATATATATKPSQSQQSTMVDLFAQQSPFLLNSLENAGVANLNPNFYTILEAIRQLEENTTTGINSTTSTSTKVNQQQQPNVLVR